jgi:hypothetical protein
VSAAAWHVSITEVAGRRPQVPDGGLKFSSRFLILPRYFFKPLTHPTPS